MENTNTSPKKNSWPLRLLLIISIVLLVAAFLQLAIYGGIEFVILTAGKPISITSKQEMMLLLPVLAVIVIIGGIAGSIFRKKWLVPFTLGVFAPLSPFIVYGIFQSVPSDPLHIVFPCIMIFVVLLLSILNYLSVKKVNKA